MTLTHPHLIFLPPHLLLSFLLCWKRSAVWVLLWYILKFFVLELEVYK